MVMVLDTVGLPAEDVTIILAVDWLLDRWTLNEPFNEINTYFKFVFLNFIGSHSVVQLQRIFTFNE